ncbi:hypothetical protein J6590_016731 [Homalodisca vitripennis]|nr:hypothetical protein J6590_016731 [Homalodisca vitripennis]
MNQSFSRSFRKVIHRELTIVVNALALSNDILTRAGDVDSALSRLRSILSGVGCNAEQVGREPRDNHWRQGELFTSTLSSELHHIRSSTRLTLFGLSQSS